tara:strand:- start:30 stop:194 length:165 start_codon:yes stop_codon:yes gene_type:complete
MMISAKIERLKRDSRRLKGYVHKLAKKGKIDIATKVQKRKDFLDEHIAEMKKVG